MDVNIRQHCPVARSLNIIGDKWSILILRNLALDGPYRFQDFTKALPGISPTTLSARLKTLQNHGLVGREVVDAHPPKTVYSLTPLGEQARPIIRALREFGAHFPDKT